MTPVPSMRDQLRDIYASAGSGSWIFHDAEFVWARVAVDPAAARAHLPWGLKMRDPATAVLFLAHYPKTTFGSVYSEAGLLLDVWHRWRPAVHCPWMLVDDDIALIAGRELLGYPKKLGAFTLSFGDALRPDRFEGEARRRGEVLLRMRATLHEPDPAPPPLLGQRVVNVRGTPGFGLRLVCFEPRETVVEARHATVELEIGHSDRDPLHRFGIGEVLDARYTRIHIGTARLPHGLRPVWPTFALRNWPFRYS